MNCSFNGIDMRTKKDKVKSHYEEIKYLNINFALIKREDIINNKKCIITDFINNNLTDDEYNHFYKEICKMTNEYFYIVGKIHNILKSSVNINDITDDDIELIFLIDARSNIQVKDDWILYLDNKNIKYNEEAETAKKVNVYNCIFETTYINSYGEEVEEKYRSGTLIDAPIGRFNLVELEK